LISAIVPDVTRSALTAKNRPMWGWLNIDQSCRS